MTEIKSPEHIINETYFNLASDSGKLKSFLIGEVEDSTEGYKIKIITCKDPDEWDLQFEDKFRAELQSKSINIAGFETEKVPIKRFIERTLKLEDIIKRKIGCNFLDTSNIEKFAKDVFSIAEEMRSSDVHIYPSQKSDSLEGVIKMRVDGRLREIKRLPEKDFLALTEYLQERVPDAKMLKDRKSLEGSFFLNGTNDTSYRLSSMQINASKAAKKDLYSSVVRILKTKDINFSLNELGYSIQDEEKIRNMIKERRGVIAIVGRVGMGKSTTLACLANEISKANNDEVKIITVEDPVEYYIKNALQIKVTAKENAENELTYAEAFKNCLRQDPDVMLIGETRNEATTKQLFDLAHTGNLSITTFHASDIDNAFGRLASYGIDGLTMCGSLLGIISQILIRQNCDKCMSKRIMSVNERDYFFQRPIENTEEYDKFIEKNLLPEIAESSGVYEGKICQRCEGTGYFNRKPIVEIYTHVIDNDEILFSICNKDPNGRRKMKELFKKGVYEPFALGALNMIFDQATSPKEIMTMLPPSYFRDFSELLIKRTNEAIAES